MADDRTRAHAAAGPDEEIHDDDELAAALAAELERIAPTGAVPVLRASAVPFGPVRTADPAPVPESESLTRFSRPSAEGTTETVPPLRPAGAVPVWPPADAGSPRRAHATPSEASPGVQHTAGIRPDALAPRSARRQGAPPRESEPELEQPREQHHRHAEESARHAGRAARATRLHAVREAPDEGQEFLPAAEAPPPTPVRVKRIPSFSTTGEPRPDATPGRRRAADPDSPPTQPVPTPEAVHPPSGPGLPEPLDLQDPLRETGPLPLPPTLYESWEESLRSIGRPRIDDWPAATVADHSDPDAATMSLSRAALGLLPAPPAPSEQPQEGPPAAADAAPEPRRRRRARRATIAPAEEQPTGTGSPAHAVPTASPGDPSVVAEAPIADEEVEGVDEVDAGMRAVSAAHTASVPLPPMVERATPVTGPMPVVQSAIAAGAVGERRIPLGGASLPALLLLWSGALASPVLVLAGFGLAAVGAGGAAAGALVLGVGVAVPAAVRLTAAADADRVGSPAIAARLFGARGGPAVAWVLLAARLLAAAIALLGVADLAGAFTARTGVGGASSSAASVAAALVAGLGALVAVAWPRRITRTVAGVLAAVALVVVLFVLAVTAPAVATSVPTAPPAASAVLAGAVGFAVPGLLLAATVADAARLASGRRRGRGATAAIVLSAVLGLVVLVLALAVGRGAGASGDAATAFAGVVVDATPAPLAAPLAIALLVAALPLPVLLLATSGDAAAVLIGTGRSARLGSIAAGLLVLALALALYATGLTAPTALATIGPVLAVPVAVWTGLVTLAPLRSGATRAVRTTLLVSAAAATVAGWLLVDGLAAVGGRSPVLDLLGIPLGSAWRGGPALGLAAGFVLGLLAAMLARVAASRAAAPPASRLRSGGAQPVDSVEG